MVIGEIKPPDEEKIKFNIDKLPSIKGDYNCFTCFFNLLSNAIKFTGPEEKSIIKIKCWPENYENTYYVKDNGVDFDMKYAGKLFGVFQRLHGKEDFKGIGVELSIVKQIIEKLGR
ncbi:MAG: hypothetical protein J7M18_06810 [Candidatus Eremiobacteraeota bacterium]|nr:hypothetical protein [Candidatus Eremiobacteraeota bacterium]